MYPANITRAEAAERARLIQATSYAVLIDLTPDLAKASGKDPEQQFWSHSTIHFNSHAGASFVNLIADEVTQLVLDGTELGLNRFQDDKIHFEVPAGPHQLSVGAWCRYSHTGEGLHRFTDPADGLSYCYSQFETADARRMYACFEQPDLKASFGLTVNAPANWVVFSNSPSPQPNKIGHQIAEHVFAATPRISSYLTALLAGPYHVVRDSHQGRVGTIPLSLACRRSLAPFLDSAPIFATTKAGLDVYEQAFGQPYPFAKYDQIFVPEFNFGAMENAGCITFRDEYLFRSKTTRASHNARNNTILHEMAHMWFGDLVTMKWWDDLWLNESFAEWASHWCQAQIRNSSPQTNADPADDPWVTFANNRKNWAYRQDQLPSTHPIAADMVDLEAVELNFDGITYAKGASVLKQLVAYVGEQPFLAGLRAYFAKHAWGNTTFADLLAALSASSGRDLSQFAAQWLRTTGPNTLRAEFTTDAANRFTHFALRQTGDPLRQHRIAIGFYEPSPKTGRLSRVHRIETDLATELTEIPAAIGRERPALILLNDDDLSYAKIRLDERSLRTVRDQLADLDSPLARALCWGAAWDMCRDAEIPAADYINLVLGAVGSETDLTGVGTLLGQAKLAVDHYSPRGRRHGLNRRFATAAFELASLAEPGSDHQLAFFRAAVASAPTDLAPADGTPGERKDRLAGFLRACLTDGATLSGLVIDTDLRWRIVTQLAQLGIVSEAEIAAELSRDFTAQGNELAAGARAAQPNAEAKAAAWELAVVRDDTPNETHAKICGQFWQFDQDAVLEPYLPLYLAAAEAISAGRDGWDTRSPTIRHHVLSLLFPAPLMDRERLDQIQRWFAQTELSDSVRRQLSECIDAAERALRCQAAS